MALIDNNDMKNAYHIRVYLLQGALMCIQNSIDAQIFYKFILSRS